MPAISCFTALKNVLYTGLKVRLVCGTHLSGRAIHDHIGHSKKIVKSTVGVACGLEGGDFRCIVVGAVQRVALSDGQIAAERRAGFGHYDDLHVVLVSTAPATRFPIVLRIR